LRCDQIPQALGFLKSSEKQVFRKNLPERYVVPRGRQRPGENHVLAGERPGLEPALPLNPAP
jgi:hypothetical protein